MPERTIITGILFILLIAMVVIFVELFIPISAKIEMNLICRHALLEMETMGELTGDDEKELVDALKAKGFSNITVNAAAPGGYGSGVNLTVEADYSYSRLKSIFQRSNEQQHMRFNKTSINRRVIN